jgi:hypothetical protein
MGVGMELIETTAMRRSNGHLSFNRKPEAEWVQVSKVLTSPTLNRENAFQRIYDRPL